MPFDDFFKADPLNCFGTNSKLIMMLKFDQVKNKSSLENIKKFTFDSSNTAAGGKDCILINLQTESHK